MNGCTFSAGLGRSGLIAALAVFGLGCPAGDDGGAGGSTGGSGGGSSCFGPYPWELSSAPDFKNVVSGFPKPTSWSAAKTWNSVAVGHVDNAANHTGCCFDYALASNQDSEITIIYGSGGSGLTVLAPTTPAVWDIGTGTVIDVALADVNGDRRNDLVALTSEDELEVWKGQATSPYFLSSSTEVTATAPVGFGVATGHNQIAIGDLDCDGKLDVAMPASRGVVVRRTTSTTALLNGSFYVDLDDDVEVREIALGDVNGDGKLDVVGGTESGDVRVALNGCNGVFATPDVYPLGSMPFVPANLHVAVGQVCPGHPTATAILVGLGDRVLALCGDGSGDFSNVTEPHAQEDDHGFDYVWDTAPQTSGPVLKDIAVFPGHAEVFVITSGGDTFMALVPSDCGTFVNPDRNRIMTQRLDTSGSTHLVLHPATTSATTWRRALIPGTHGLTVLQ